MAGLAGVWDLTTVMDVTGGLTVKEAWLVTCVTGTPQPPDSVAWNTLVTGVAPQTWATRPVTVKV